MPSVYTVLGPIDAATLRDVMPHEHLLSLTPGRWMKGGQGDFIQQQIDLAVTALSGLAEQGINTIVDLSPYGVVGRNDDGSNVSLLQEISRRSKLHIVAGSAIYLEAMSPSWTLEADLAAVTSRFINDATGIGPGTVAAGVFGEQATSLDKITPHEEKCLRAAARAAKATGRALFTHTTHGTMALEQVAIVRQEHLDLSRVVIGHMDTHHDLNYVRAVLDTGVNIAFDTIGKVVWDFFLGPPKSPRIDGPFMKNAYHQSDLQRARWLVQLVADGFQDRILLSQDLTGSEVYLNPETHGYSGYSYLGGRFTTLLCSLGVKVRELKQMMHENPMKLLSISTDLP